LRPNTEGGCPIFASLQEANNNDSNTDRPEADERDVNADELIID
jgi:hypothetical protein